MTLNDSHWLRSAGLARSHQQRSEFFAISAPNAHWVWGGLPLSIINYANLQAIFRDFYLLEMKHEHVALGR